MRVLCARDLIKKEGFLGLLISYKLLNKCFLDVLGVKIGKNFL